MGIGPSPSTTPTVSRRLLATGRGPCPLSGPVESDQPAKPTSTQMACATRKIRAWAKWTRVACATAPAPFTNVGANPPLWTPATALETRLTPLAFVGEIARPTRTEMACVTATKSSVARTLRPATTTPKPMPTMGPASSPTCGLFRRLNSPEGPSHTAEMSQTFQWATSLAVSTVSRKW